MAAWDNVSLPGAPAAPSYAAPLVNFAPLGNLANDYFQGTQQKRTLALQSAFKDGLPRDENGNLDINSMADTLARLGGADAAQPLMKLQIEQQIAKGNAGAIGAGGTTPGAQPDTGYAPPTARPAVPEHGIPGGTGAGGTGVQPPEQQPQAAAQPDTLTNIVRAGLKDPNRFDDVMKVAKGSLGIDDFTTVDPNSPAGKRVASFINSANGNPGFTPTGGTAGQPAPAPQTFAQRADQAFTPFQNGGVALRAPAASDLEARARQFENNANVASRRAASIGGFEGQGPAAAALEKYAEGQMAQAKLLREQIAKQQEQTTEEKNVSSGATAQTELVKSNIKRGELAYGGITSQATQWERDLKPYNDIAKAVVNDPSTWTGIGAEARLDVNKLIAIYGDKKGAMMQEALQKVRASSVLGQMNVMRDQMQEAGSQSGRIFAQYADLAQQASPGMETTLGGNRFLVNVQSRMGELSSKVAQEARTYKAAHGYLDAGWDQHLANYMQTNSPFTKAEMAEPALLGAPTMPAFNDPKKVAAWAASMGVRPGEPVRTQTGRYVVPIPAPRQAPAQPAQPAGQGMLQPGQT